MTELRIEYVSKDELKPYANNAKIHTDEQIKQIRRSIEKFGFNDPIALWHENEVVEGHGRLLAVMGMDSIETVPVIRLDELSDEQRRAYMLAHNQLTMNTGFDLDVLAVELDDIYDFDMSEFGFDVTFEEEPADLVEVEVPEPPKEPKSKYGDIYQLGNHRLMCGDSTNYGDVGKLLDDELADVVVTDPPYNMGYEGAGNTRDRASKRIMNDKMPAERFRKFLNAVYGNYYTAMKDGASIYVFYKELGEGVFIQSMADAGLTFKQELVWVKNQIVLGGSKYQSMYEPCLFGCKGKVGTWNGKRKQRAVIETVDLMNEDELRAAIKELLEEEPTDVLRERKQLVNDLHPTMKPVRLIARLVRNSSNRGDIVLDLFGGSGTTLVACEQIDRRCCMMELDPRYVDVIIERWENFTGEKAKLING